MLMLAPAALATALLLAAPAPAPQPADAGLQNVLAQFAKLVELRDVALSPDGGRLAWTQSQNGPSGPIADKGELFLLDLAKSGAAPLRFGACKRAGGCDEGSPVFSPDGKSLAFLSDAAAKGQRQLYLRDLAKGTSRQLTKLAGAVSSPAFSPDGARLSALVIEGDVDAAGPLGPAARDVGVIQQVIHESRIAVVPAAGGSSALVSPPDLFVYEYDWSPDGKSFAYTGAHGAGDDNWWIAELFTQKSDGGPALSIHKPQLQIAVPRWSPDGASIAFVGGLMSDEGLNGGDLFVLPSGGGAPRNLTPGRKSSPSWLQWTGPDRLVFAEWAAGESAIAALRPSDGAVTPLWRGPRHVGTTDYALSLALAKDGDQAAFVLRGGAQPPEVFAGALSAPAVWAQRSRANAVQAAPWGEVRSIQWTNEGFTEQGFLTAPKNIEPGRKYPMIAIVHGGPSWAVHPDFDEQTAVLASAGYFVFRPNPRGSFGQGEAYTAANVRDFGGGDLRDLLAGVEAAIAQAPIDPQRIGLTGWSYGGYMTMWAVTQTTRFKAAVAGAGIANWQSYYGQNKIDQWMLPFFGASVYDDPATYRKASPIEFIKATKTPTLILQGERDAEVPAPQALEFWHALKALSVPTELVIYEGEGHVFRKPENVRDRHSRTVGWFDKYLR